MNKKNKDLEIQNFPKVEINFSPKNPVIPKIADKTKIDVRYCLIAPFAYAHIYWDQSIMEVVYDVEEPKLDTAERQYREELTTAMKDLINYDIIVGKSDEELEAYIERNIKILAIELGMDFSYESYRKIFYYLSRDFMGFNDVEPLLRDYFIEDIECNGANAQIFVVHRAFRNLKTNIMFKHLYNLASFV